MLYREKWQGAAERGEPSLEHPNGRLQTYRQVIDPDDEACEREKASVCWAVSMANSGAVSPWRS